MEMQIGSIVPMNVIWKFDSVKKTDFLSDNIDVKKTLWYFSFDKNRN